MPTIIGVGSVSNAMRGKRLLEQHGVRAYVRRQAAPDDNGCGYGLLVTDNDPRIVTWLQDGGVRVTRVKGRDGA